jgi:hypothetical protein
MGVPLTYKTALRVLSLIFIVYLFIGIFQAGSLSKAEADFPQRLIPVQYSKQLVEEKHIFLAPDESLTFSAPQESDGLKFTGIDVLLNSTNLSFLRVMNTDLYVESYEYWGNMGAWTPNNNFTLTNPTSDTQELFLKISQNFGSRTYISDVIDGKVHTIKFTTEIIADRVVVNWGFFGALKYLEINGSQVDVSDLVRDQNQMMLELFPYSAAFHLPSSLRIDQTEIMAKVEEEDLPLPPEYCSIGALSVEQKNITLDPYQQLMFDIPRIDGWTYLAGTIYSNLTVSEYPKPYPFKLINVAVWDPNANPLLMTLADITFGIRNLSNETYDITLDLALYYWQNQSGLTYSHEIISSDDTPIYHKLSVNISNANVGAELGLAGQYLRLRVPGRVISYDAPDPVGRFSGSYIPLREGSYTLFTREDRIVTNVTLDVNDLILQSKLRIKVTYGGESYADANITVAQKGTFTSRTYEASTDQNGEATIAVVSNGPEMNQLTIKVAKDDYNYTEQTLSVTVGISWILTALIVIALTVLLVVFIRKRKKRK